MTSFTRRGAVLGALAAGTLAPVTATAQSSSIQNITGSYRSKGRNPDGSAYEGSAAIVQNGGKVTITWTLGGQTYSGQGVRDGLVVVVDWGTDHPIVYVVMPNGNLHGTWADGLALDKLVKL